MGKRRAAGTEHNACIKRAIIKLLAHLLLRQARISIQPNKAIPQQRQSLHGKKLHRIAELWVKPAFRCMGKGIQGCGNRYAEWCAVRINRVCKGNARIAIGAGYAFLRPLSSIVSTATGETSLPVPAVVPTSARGSGGFAPSL